MTTPTRAPMRIPRQMLLAGSAASLSLLLAACGGGGGGGNGFPWNFGNGGGGGNGGDGGATGGMEVRTLSTRADLVSDGDVLVELLPEGGNAGGLKVTLNGKDITDAFARRADGRITGLATGLAVGSNTIKASTRLNREATLTVVNAPRSGPVLSSTQFTPYVCATPAPTTGAGATPASNASGLSTSATDAQCSIATEFKLFYRTLTPVTAAPGDGGCSFVPPDPSPATAGGPVPPTPANSCLQPYVAGTTPASAVASTTTTTGVKVPYIVRVERGTINRGIYDIAVLFDPSAPAWTATSPQPQWNRKLLYSFGAGTGFPRLQFRSSQNWADDAALSRGFMVVDNSMTDSQLNGNRYLVAETTLMMKEHVIDSYGEVLYMMGNGGSGGAINQNSVASLLPGVIDGTQLGVDFADSETTAMEVMDCVQLVNFYQSPAWTALQVGATPTQVNAKKKAINGHLDHTACHGWLTFFGGLLKSGNYTPLGVADNATGAIVPTGAPTNNCQLPASLVYDPASNPTGPRCGITDGASSVYGTTANALAPSGVRGLSNLDNVGIQYGLKALKSGAISAEEFVTLNEKVGGSDTDGNLSAARAVADADSLSIAYRAGLVSPGGNLAKVATIDLRAYDETYNLPIGQAGIHQYWRSYSHRARIDAAAGGHANHALWRFGPAGTPPSIPVEAFLAMDAWLTGLVTSSPKEWTNAERTQQQVAAARPAAASDLCYLSADTTFSTKVLNTATCDADPVLLPQGSPRQVAGGPLTEDILKCQLKPLAAADYAPVTFSPTQWSRLQVAFAQGVCDWSKPGVGQVQTAAPMTFRAGAGGKPLGPRPASS
ncbi:DUF6351 family protein [Variovorax paradoxus]|nr:DUF6351 family protein [Variovorax paradoxus]